MCKDSNEKNKQYRNRLKEKKIFSKFSLKKKNPH